jgi:hypothetical protein
MSNVNVNLLPDDVRRKGQRSRQNTAVAVGFGVLVLAVGGVYVWQLQRVDDAQAVVDDEQAELQALQAELGELGEFEQLRDLRAEGDRVVTTAMAGEASVAGVLQDVAAVMPPDAQLATMNATVTGQTDGDLGDQRTSWGSITMTGETRLGHAPGLERFLLEFDKIDAFADLYFSNSVVDERGVSSFNAELDLGPEILTGRYLDGLPEEMR